MSLTGPSLGIMTGVMIDLRVHNSSSSSFHSFPKDSQKILTIVTSATVHKCQEARSTQDRSTLLGYDTTVKSIQVQTCTLLLSGVVSTIT